MAYAQPTTVASDTHSHAPTVGHSAPHMHSGPGLAGNGATGGHYGSYSDGDHHGGTRSTIFLRPIADPGALGWSGYAVGTFIVSSWLARWWGDGNSPFTYFAFLSIFAGLAQFIAGLKAFPARDNMYTCLFTVYGSFYLAFGILSLLYAYGVGSPRASFGPQGVYGRNTEFGSWWIGLFLITLPCAIAAIRRDVVQAITLWTAVLGTILGIAGFFRGNRSVIKAAAYIMLISAFFAWVRASLYIIEDNIAPSAKGNSTHGRTAAMPLGSAHGGSDGIDDGAGEAGVKRGGHATRQDRNSIDDSRRYGDKSAAPVA